MYQYNSLVPFDYFLFVQLWPGSWIYGDNLRYNFTNDYFTFHGTWPQFDNGSYPEWCNRSAQFDVNKLRLMFDNLTKYWTDFRNAPSFWEHEFLKHMVCTNSRNPYKFFWWGLFFRERYNVYEVLKKNKIIPMNNFYYKTQLIESVIKEAFEKDIVLICDKNNILNEIRFCVDKEHILFDCPQTVLKEKCKKEFVWFNYVSV